MAAKMMRELDPNNTGSVTKDQFLKVMAAKGLSTADATKMYDAIDTKSTGSITKADIQTAIQNGAIKPPPKGAQGNASAGQAGSGGGPKGGAKPGAAGGASGSSSSTTSYAPADANHDGVVSLEEAALYAAEHPSITPKTTDASKLGQNVDQYV
jgi:Ca2+-binding EF-hand superfamily protein